MATVTDSGFHVQREPEKPDNTPTPERALLLFAWFNNLNLQKIIIILSTNKSIELI